MFIRAEWSSAAKEKQIPPALTSLGKMLVRGTLKQIASAAWKSPAMKSYIVADFLKAVHHECTGLSSRKARSMLRQTSKEEILAFSFEKQEEELKDRARLFNAVLTTASTKTHPVSQKAPISKKKQSVRSTVCMSASICLKNMLLNGYAAAGFCHTETLGSNGM